MKKHKKHTTLTLSIPYVEYELDSGDILKIDVSQERIHNLLLKHLSEEDRHIENKATEKEVVYNYKNFNISDIDFKNVDLDSEEDIKKLAHFFTKTFKRRYDCLKYKEHLITNKIDLKRLILECFSYLQSPSKLAHGLNLNINKDNLHQFLDLCFTTKLMQLEKNEDVNSAYGNYNFSILLVLHTMFHDEIDVSTYLAMKKYGIDSNLLSKNFTLLQHLLLLLSKSDIITRMWHWKSFTKNESADLIEHKKQNLKKYTGITYENSFKIYTNVKSNITKVYQIWPKLKMSYYSYNFNDNQSDIVIVDPACLKNIDFISSHGLDLLIPNDPQTAKWLKNNELEEIREIKIIRKLIKALEKSGIKSKLVKYNYNAYKFVIPIDVNKKTIALNFFNTNSQATRRDEAHGAYISESHSIIHRNISLYQFEKNEQALVHLVKLISENNNFDPKMINLALNHKEKKTNILSKILKLQEEINKLKNEI